MYWMKKNHACCFKHIHFAYWICATKYLYPFNICYGLSWWFSIKNPPASAGDTGLTPGVGRAPGEGNGNPPQLLLPGRSHGRRSLVGHRAWGPKTVRRDLVTSQQQIRIIHHIKCIALKCSISSHTAHVSYEMYVISFSRGYIHVFMETVLSPTLLSGIRDRNLPQRSSVWFF